MRDRIDLDLDTNAAFFPHEFGYPVGVRTGGGGRGGERKSEGTVGRDALN